MKAVDGVGGAGESSNDDVDRSSLASRTRIGSSPWTTGTGTPVVSVGGLPATGRAPARA
jgi:hypothetical protein